jgi:hypothetical protein
MPRGSCFAHSAIHPSPSSPNGSASPHRGSLSSPTRGEEEGSPPPLQTGIPRIGDDGVAHAVDILQHVVVPEAQDTEAPPSSSQGEAGRRPSRRPWDPCRDRAATEPVQKGFILHRLSQGSAVTAWIPGSRSASPRLPEDDEDGEVALRLAYVPEDDEGRSGAHQPPIPRHFPGTIMPSQRS